MINLDEINGEIAKLEVQPTTLMTVQKLAWLYIVRDHITIPSGQPQPVFVELMPEGDSEFMQACQKKSVSQDMAILDEMMDTIQMIHPRLYEAVMERLRD